MVKRDSHEDGSNAEWVTWGQGDLGPERQAYEEYELIGFVKDASSCYATH